MILDTGPQRVPASGGLHFFIDRPNWGNWVDLPAEVR